MIFSEVVEGQELKHMESGTIIRKGKAARGIRGQNNTGIVLDDELLSKHILALGSIGSGKSNLMYHIVKSIIGSIKENDIIVFFDAKGDYLSEFYREGDFVIGNKNRLHGKYKVALWNIYKDIIMSPEEEQLDTIREITSSLFKKYIDSSQNPTFIMGARDILTAVITCHLREMKDKNVTWNNKKLKDLLNKSVAKDLRENMMIYFGQLRI